MRNRFDILLVLAIVCLLIFTAIKNSNQKSERVADAVNKEMVRVWLIDSVNMARDMREIVLIDSVVSAEKKIRDKRSVSITALKQKAKIATIAYNEDSVHTNACDSAISAYKILTDSLSCQVVSDSVLISKMDLKARIMVGIIESKQNVIDNAYRNIDKLNRELTRKNNWWNRNGKWFYLIGGAAIGYSAFR